MLPVLVVLSSVVIKCESASILAVYLFPSISHHIVFRSYTNELLARGHDVTVLTPFPEFPNGDGPANLTEVNIIESTKFEWIKYLECINGKSNSIYPQYEIGLEIIAAMIDNLLQSTEYKELIRSKKTYDLILLEGLAKNLLVLSNLFEVPVVQFASIGGLYRDFERMGAESHPLIYPLYSRQRIYNMTYWVELKEWYKHYWIDRLYYSYQIKIDRIIAKYHPEISLRSVKNYGAMYFFNIFHVVDFNRPTPLSVLYLGGIHLKSSLLLPEDLKTFLDNSKQGVIYVSFGTNYLPKLISPKVMDIFVNVFSRLPYNIIWKWENEELSNRSRNIKVYKWVPQSDLLRHPNVKLFITQGGLQSTDEAIAAGVPLIGLPLSGDQWYNTEHYRGFGIGEKLSFEFLNEGELNKTIADVIGNNSYRRNIVKLRTIMYDRRQTSIQRAVWWTEYVLRFGGDHLQSPAADMHWTHYYEAELVLIVSSFIVILFVLLFAILKYFFYFIKSRFVRRFCSFNKTKID